MTADFPNPPAELALRAAIRPTFSFKRDLGEVALVTVREGGIACLFKTGELLELQGDPEAWLAQLGAAIKDAQSGDVEED